MATPVPIDMPVLNCTRAAANRRKGWLLGAVTVLSLTPFIYGVSWVAAGMFVARPGAGAAQISRAEAALRAETKLDDKTRDIYERAIEKKKVEVAAQEKEGYSRFYELAIVLAGAQSALLALLFWSIAASPSSKLLVDAGATPAGQGERDAREILELLSASAGVPPPKLYLIESSAVNAFSAELGRGQSVVAVTRGLLQLLDREELEGVLAHELSHIANEDVRLNTTAACIALFLRIPYLLFRRQLEAGKRSHVRRGRNPWRLALSPMGVYILFVAPVLAGAIRAAVSRNREFQADNDAVSLTGTPQGLLRALAKIGGSGSVLAGANPAFAHFYFCSPLGGKLDFSTSLMGTHPLVADRIQRLASLVGAPSVETMKEAIETGRRYAREHPVESLHGRSEHDELASFNRGNPMGRVYRLLGGDPVPVLETPTPNAAVLTRVKPGSLVVVFDDPGKMRQINTAQQVFGYIDRGVKLMAVDNLIPAEIYDPVARAAAEANLPPLESIPMTAAQPKSDSLSFDQILAATALGLAVFAGIFFALMKFGH